MMNNRSMLASGTRSTRHFMAVLSLGLGAMRPAPSQEPQAPSPTAGRSSGSCGLCSRKSRFHRTTTLASGGQPIRP